MKTQTIIARKTKHGITTRIIQLHEKGYHLDFRLLEAGMVQCLQDSRHFEIGELSLLLIDHLFDHCTRSFQYIYGIETTSGYKGVLLCNNPFACKIPARLGKEQTLLG